MALPTFDEVVKKKKKSGLPTFDEVVEKKPVKPKEVTKSSSKLPSFDEVIKRESTYPKELITPNNFKQTFSTNADRMAKEQTYKPVAKEDSLLDKSVNAAKSVGRGIADFKTKFEDSTSFGLTNYLDKKIMNSGILPDEISQKYLADMERAESSVGGKIGEFAGYIAPGAAIDKAVVKLGGKALQKLSPVVGGIVRGSVAGGAEAALQETGDVAFRGKEFDPLNVALGTGAGGVLGGAVPLIGQGINKLRNRKLPTFDEAIQQPAKIDDIPKDVFPEPVKADAVKQGWNERLFGNEVMGITPQSLTTTRNRLSTEGQIVDKPLKQSIEGVTDSTKAAGRSAYQNLVDNLDPIKKISKEAYDASIDANRANQISNVIVTDKFVTPQGEVVGEGLQGIVRKAGRGNYNAFTDYLTARHAVTRMARGEEVYDKSLNITADSIAERVKTLETQNPGFKEIGEEWDGYFKNVRKHYGVDEGLISQKLADVLEAKNPNYSPMNRQFSTSEKIKGATQSGAKPMFSGQKAPLKEVSPVGSTRKIVDPVRSTIEQTGAWVNASMRNRPMKLIAEKITADPEGMKGIARIVQPPKGQPKLRDILETEGEERFLEVLQEDFNKLFSRTALDKDNIVRAMVKGEPVYMEIIDPEAIKALVGMGAEQSNLAISIFSGLSNTIKRGATGALSPMFAAKSLSMDVAQAIIQSENPIQHSGYLIGSIVSSIADAMNIPKLRNMAQDFQRSGGGYSAALRGERGLKKGVSDMRLDPLLSPRGIAKGIGKTIAAPYKVSMKVADMSENFNRIAAFNYKIRQLGGERTPENIRDAMNYAREITTNYSRKGAQARGLEAFIPYNNAATQGLYRFAKAWKKNPVKTAAMIGTLVIAPKMQEYMRFHDDEDYQKLTARERYRNIIVGKNDDGTFSKIPVSPEYNAIGALVVDMLRAYKDGDPEAFKGTSDAVVNAFTPPVVSGLLQGVTQGGGIEQSIAGTATSLSTGPLTSVLANQSFTGGPIESMKVADRSPQYRYDERTSKVARVIGDKLKFSPMKIDYLLRSFGGDPARLLLPLTSEVGAGTARNTLARAWIVDPVFSNTLTDDYYRGKEALSQAYRDSKEVGAELPEWYSEDLRKYISSTARDSLSSKIKSLTDEKKALTTNTLLTPIKKSQDIRDVQRQINELYLEANAKMKEANVPILNR